MTVGNAMQHEKTSLVLRRVVLISLLIQIVGLEFSMAVSSIGFSVAVVAWIAKMAYERKFELKGTPLDYFFLAYAVAEVLSTVFAVYKWDSFVNMKRLLLISVVYMTFRSVTTEKNLKLFLGSIIACASALAIVQIAVYFTEKMHRLSAFQHYMTAGGVLMIVLLLAIPFVIHQDTPRKIRLYGSISMVPLFVALLLTYTRSSWLGLVAGAITIGLVKSKYVLFVLVSLTVVFLLFAPLSLRERATSIFDPNDVSNASRIHMWKTGIQILKDYPILGVGDSDLGEIYRKYTTPLTPDEGGHLHNNYVHLLVTLGIIGFLAVMAIFTKILVVEVKIYRAFKNEWLASSVALGSLAVFVGFLINGLFEWNFGDQEIISLVWCTIGLTLAAENISAGRMPQHG